MSVVRVRESVLEKMKEKKTAKFRLRVVDDFAPVSNFQEIKRENEIVGPSNISAICL